MCRGVDTTGQVSVPIRFLDPGNQTCPGWHFARYSISSGTIDRFSVDGPFQIDRVSPPGWDVVNFYGYNGYVVVRMPNQTYTGSVVLRLSGTLNSPESGALCP
jgi:hypothetical protein